MSWNILPKNVLQYFLTKLKDIFDTKVDKETGKGLFSGSYNDLTNKPTIPAAQVNSNWNATSGVAQILNKPSLATVATSGSYNDLSNKPTIPDVSGKVDKITSGGVATCGGNGQYSYFKIATLTVTGTYCNGPIAFELSQRHYEVTMIQVCFASVNNTDPDISYFITNFRTNYWICKESTSTWGLYGSYSEKWGSCALHRVVGFRVNNGVSVTINMTNSGDPSVIGQVRYQVAYGGNCSYATSAGNANTVAGFSVLKSVPANAVFTDTNNAVTISHSNNNAVYPICWEGHNDTGTYTTQIFKCTALAVNPYHVYLYVKHTSNGTYTIINSTGIYFRNDTSARIWCDGNQQIWIAASSESDYKLFLGVANKSWMFGPGGNGKVTLGQASYRWGQIYSTNASISTSDRKEKKDIVPLDDSAIDFIMALNPVSYKMINGDSGRTHYGMIAQDVEEELDELGMTAMDFAGFCKDQKYERYEEVVDKVTTTRERKVEGEYIYGLRYEEFIAPLIKTVQLQQQEIEELKHRIDILEGK